MVNLLFAIFMVLAVWAGNNPARVGRLVHRSPAQAPPNAAHASPTPPMAQTKAQEVPPAPIKADPGFIEEYEDLMLVVSEIGRIESATGTVQIPVSLADLRIKYQHKLADLQKWAAIHHVPAKWEYNSQKGEFAPPKVVYRTVPPAVVAPANNGGR